VLCLPDRLTPTYTKPLRRTADGDWRELNRLDVRTRGPLSAAATAEICRRLEAVFRTSDGLIVLDQLIDENCGVVSAAVRDTLARLASESPDKLIFVDSRRFLDRFTAAVLKGNRSEVAGKAGDAEVSASLLNLAQRSGRPAFCTIGERGILVAKPDGEATIVPGVPVNNAIDIVGAGDSATSGIVCALLSGATAAEAAALGNLVASITIQQLGRTGTATPHQVREAWRALDHGESTKPGIVLKNDWR